MGGVAQRVLDGLEDLSTWDEEELRRGTRRSADGSFRGRKPTVVPKALHDELYRRTIEHAQELFRKSLPDAIKTVVALATDPTVDASVRLNAAKFAVERVMGKAPQQINLTAEKPLWERFMASVVIDRELPAPADAEIIDAEVVEDEPEWEWDEDVA